MERQRYRTNLESREAYASDVTQLKDIEERQRLNDERKKLERETFRSRHPYLNWFFKGTKNMARSIARLPKKEREQAEVSRLASLEKKVDYILYMLTKKMQRKTDQFREQMGFGGQAIRDYIFHPSEISQTERRRTRIMELMRQIEEAEKPVPMPLEVLNNPTMTPEQKVQIQKDMELNRPKIDTTLLRAELYELQHPLISRRIREQGERFMLKNGRMVYVAPEDLEAFYKSYGSNKGRPGHSDEIKEDILETARMAEGQPEMEAPNPGPEMDNSMEIMNGEM